MNYWGINTPTTLTPNKLTQSEAMKRLHANQRAGLGGTVFNSGNMSKAYLGYNGTTGTPSAGASAPVPYAGPSTQTDTALLQALSTPIPRGVGKGGGVTAKLKSGTGSAKQGLGKLGGYFKNNFGWDAGSGITAFGKNIGKGMNIASGVFQVADAATGLNELSKTKDKSKDIADDILLEAMQSPNVMNDLTTDQLELLRQLRSGEYDHGGDIQDVDLAGVLGKGGIGALTGLLTGGVPGAFIGGIGGAANSAIDDMVAGNNTDALQNLYVTLANANQNRRMARSGNVLPAVY